MKTAFTEIYICPKCAGNLQYQQASENKPGGLFCPNCQLTFKDDGRYIDFMGAEKLEYRTGFEKTVRRIYAKVYTPFTNFMFLFCGGVKNAKAEVLNELQLSENARVLETGIGASENFYLLSKRSKSLHFFGLDIQKQMLLHSTRNLKKWGIEARLSRADAHHLPFADASFDVVFHLGSINLFPDKKQAISEMIRVSRPGTKIVIADEAGTAGCLINRISGLREEVVPPVEFIPKSMKDVTLKTIWRGNGYLISFYKPA